MKAKILTILGLLIVLGFSTANKPTSYNGFSNYSEYIRVRNAMDYHRPALVTHEGNEWWFKRSGEKIDLFVHNRNKPDV